MALPYRKDAAIVPTRLSRVTYRARQRWPPIAERVRHVIATRTATGEQCTLIVERDDAGLVMSFHGAIRATAAPCPEEAAELIEALRSAADAGGGTAVP